MNLIIEKIRDTDFLGYFIQECGGVIELGDADDSVAVYALYEIHRLVCAFDMVWTDKFKLGSFTFWALRG